MLSQVKLSNVILCILLRNYVSYRDIKSQVQNKIDLYNNTLHATIPQHHCQNYMSRIAIITIVTIMMIIATLLIGLPQRTYTALTLIHTT